VVNSTPDEPRNEEDTMHKPSSFQKALRAENRFFAGKTKRGRAWLAKKVANRLAALAGRIG
jgi:hypothetical protein